MVFDAYVSDDQRLPEQLATFKQTVQQVVSEMRQDADGRLTSQFTDPDANNGQVGQQIAENFGFQPMATSLFSDERFYFYLTLSKDDQVVQIQLDDFSESSFKRNLQSAIKRFASGFTKTVALVAPQVDPRMAQYGMAGPQFNQLENFLGAELNVKREDLSDGSVAGDSDILLLLAPKALDDKALFAVDQFLMQGGTVIAATSPFSANFSGRSLSLQPNQSGLESWLKHHGLDIQTQVIMDPQSAAFPVPVTRNAGGFMLQEMRMLDYPYFVDIRNRGLNQDNAITADLPQATIAWASPIVVNNDETANRQVTPLLTSSDAAWLSTSTDIMPRLDAQGNSAFYPEGEQSSHVLGLISQGKFDSYFAGKSSPLLEDKTAEAESQADETDSAETTEKKPVITSVIDKSPESARIILFASNDFLRDEIIQMTGSAGGSEYLTTLQLMANAVDWSLDDQGLLSIRARGHFNRTLPPMDQGSQMFWEYLNYFLAALMLAVTLIVQRMRSKSRQVRFLESLAK